MSSRESDFCSSREMSVCALMSMLGPDMKRECDLEETKKRLGLGLLKGRCSQTYARGNVDVSNRTTNEGPTTDERTMANDASMGKGVPGDNGPIAPTPRPPGSIRRPVPAGVSWKRVQRPGGPNRATPNAPIGPQAATQSPRLSVSPRSSLLLIRLCLCQV